MKAVEFKSKIQGDRILIPQRMLREFPVKQDKNVRVIVFVDDSDIYDENIFRHSAKNKFLNGYSDTDSIYDT